MVFWANPVIKNRVTSIFGNTACYNTITNYEEVICPGVLAVRERTGRPGRGGTAKAGRGKTLEEAEQEMIAVTYSILVHTGRKNAAIPIPYSYIVSSFTMFTVAALKIF